VPRMTGVRASTFRTWAARRRRTLSATATRFLREKRVREAAGALMELVQVEGTEMQSAALSAAAHLVQASRWLYRAGDTKLGARLLEVSVALTSHAMAARDQLAAVGKGSSVATRKRGQSAGAPVSTSAKKKAVFTRGR
jgi:hypothetical protein